MRTQIAGGIEVGDMGMEQGITNTQPMHATVVHRVLKTGSSRPIIVEASNGRMYLVKPQGAISGPMANICDWIACRIAAAVALPVVTPEAILLDASLDVQAVDEEMRDLLRKSYGINLAYPYYHNVRDYIPTDADLSNPIFRTLWCYDLFLLNVDRTTRNTNLMNTESGVLAFDYESSFRLMGFVDGRDYSRSASVLKALRHNPLYTESDADIMQKLLDDVRGVDIAGIVGSVPLAWIGEAPDMSGQRLVQGLIEAINDDQYYTRMIDGLRRVSVETEQERLARIRRNREMFKPGFSRD